MNNHGYQKKVQKEIKILLDDYILYHTNHPIKETPSIYYSHLHNSFCISTTDEESFDGYISFNDLLDSIFDQDLNLECITTEQLQNHINNYSLLLNQLKSIKLND